MIIHVELKLGDNKVVTLAKIIYMNISDIIIIILFLYSLCYLQNLVSDVLRELFK